MKGKKRSRGARRHKKELMKRFFVFTTYIAIVSSFRAVVAMSTETLMFDSAGSPWPERNLQPDLKEKKKSKLI